MTDHQHVQAPDNPVDGDTLTCPCGYTAEYVDLDNGQPGEWVTTSAT